MGVGNNIDESKAYFSRLLPSPQPSLAARAVPVPRGEGAYRRFALLQFATQVLNLGDFKFIPLYARPAEKNPPKYPSPAAQRDWNSSREVRERVGEGVAFWWRAQNLSVSVSISEPLPPNDYSPSACVLMNPTPAPSPVPTKMRPHFRGCPPTVGGERSFTYT